MIFTKVNMLKVIIKIIPQIVVNLLLKIYNYKYGFKGNFSSWSEAIVKCKGYEDEIIFQKVRSSLLKVKNGEAVFERDGFIFDEIEYSWPLLSGLLLASSRNDGNLNVVDFGGSLGSSYFQNRKFLNLINKVKWNVIEQLSFVKIGKSDLQDDILNFYYSIDECIKEVTPNLLLLSGVLQYLEFPYKTLDLLLKSEYDTIIVDRTPFTTKIGDIIKVQKVNPVIYDASYPCWFFNKEKFINYFIEKGYKIIEDFKGNDGVGNDYEFKGMILIKVNPND